MSNTPGDWGSHRGISLANTAHSEVAPCLPLPSLPSFCGAGDQELWFFDDQPSRPLNRSDILAQASKIADLLQETDVSYLNLKHDVIRPAYGSIQPSALYDEVLRYNPDAFQDACRGPVEERIYSTVFNRQTFQHNEPLHNQVQRDFGESHSYPHDRVLVDDIPSSSRKSQVKKKGSREISSTLPDPIKHQDAVLERFSEVLEDFLTGAEIPSEDQDDAEWLPLPNSDIRMLVNEVLSIWHEKMLHLVPVDKLARLLKVLDHQIHRAEGLSIDECEQSDSDVSSIFSALESIHAVLAVMTHNDMPKHLYKEEIIERILEFIRRQVMDVMSASDSSYRALHGPSENRVDGEEDEEADANYGSSSKKRRIYRSVKAKRTGNNRVSASVNAVLQKLCTILGFLKDLLLIERLPDSCILQLVKTSLSTLLVDNIQLLQLKAISLISGIFYSYAEHRTHIVDEVVLLLWKLPFSKRAIRAYHLQDEEQKQIQMVTALLLQLVHHSTNLPEALRQSLSCSTVLETTVDSSYLIKCHEAATETCVSFWTRILQRFTSVKSQDASELKSIMENLILDLLTTFNMPEYPASALILEVLSVLLLQNAGPKSKDTSVRSSAIEILGTIAARLKHDSALCGLDDFWIVQELACRENVDESHEKDTCSVCMDGKTEKFLAACQGCQKLFHADCMGVRELDISTHSWHCPICLSRKQLLVLQSYCKSQSVNKGKNNQSRLEQSSEAGDSISKVEIVQQILLNYLQDAGSADDHLFARWFYLCLWYKDDPKSRHKFSYRLASLNAKSIVRDSGVSSSMLARDSIKKITSALGQKSSFSRGFDTILCMLLVSLRENSPVIRAKTLRAVSMIVEADPDVLCDKRVQSAVEGRFCDSAISVREAALELVGRYIASHPDVGLKYFEKVAERVKDTGVSVRKRAIKIIREMCISNVNFIEYPRACIDIISRVTDEESSIQDLVCKTFFEFWFEEPSDAPTQFFGDSSSVPLEVAKKTEQIVDMLKKMPNHQPLVTVIKRNLALDFVPQSAKAAGINPVSLATVHKRCELMCKYLLERILQVEEMDKEEGKVRTLPYVMLLHAFCIVDPTLCAPASDPSQFVVTLQPYLKNQVDNRLVAQLLESIIFVIDAVLPFIRRLPSSVVEELEQDLKQMIVRHSFLTVVHACIKCLCTVSKIVGKRGTLIEFLIQVFFKHLDALGLDNKQLVGRSLFCLGLLIRYGHSFLSDSNRYIDVISSLSLFKKYLLVDDFVIKARALQALGFVLIARPECMLEKDVANILAATLSSACDARLKLQSLQNMYEYLLDAESKMETDKVEENEVDCSVKGGSSVPVAAGAGDTNICGGIVQLYWDNILERSLDINEQVRQLGLKIVEVVLRQGLVHPITCVPYLVALETDHLESNSKLAHHLLMNMNEKYPSFFESRLGDGLQLSFIFMQSINAASENLNMKHQHTLLGNVKGKSDDSSFANARLGVSRIYKLIRGNRVARNKFMSSVVRKFDNPRWSDTVIPFLKYCTDILALLPFTSPDEPLYLIYVINRVIQVRSGTLEANLKALSLHFSQQGSQKMVHENGIAQQELITDPVSAPTMLLEVNGTIQQEPRGQHLPIQSTLMDANMHSANFGDSHVINEDDLQRIQDVCIAATALQLLLKLKRHLKIVYSLDNVRCQAFSPTDPPKPGEVLSKQNVPLNIQGIHNDLPSTSQELTQRYQDLKNALKEDTMDYSAYTANIKRKRPPSRRGGRSARLTGRDVEDDADDDDDEEWTDGMRRPNRSGRQGSSFRGTRLRS